MEKPKSYNSGVLNGMEDNSIIVYAITERGPDIVHVNSTQPHEKIQEMALYHLLLVAQGTWHHTGVFVLPLPIDKLKDSHKAIFYGFRIYDPEQMDPRTKKTRYGCIIIFCTNELLNVLNLIDLQENLDNFLSNYASYNEIKDKKFFTSLNSFISKELSLKKKANLKYANSPVINQMNY